MKKEEAFEIAGKIAKELESALHNGTLDDKLKEVSQEEWEVYVAFTKATLDEAFKTEPKRASSVGSIFNGIVSRRILLINRGEI